MATIDTTKTYVLTNAYTGPDQYLGVSSSGPEMDSDEGDSTTQWIFTAASTSPFYYLHTISEGTKQSLDVINDNGTSSIYLQMSSTGQRTGQFWRFDLWGDGTRRLSNNFTGVDMHLDVFSDTLLPHLASGDYSGQHWSLAEVIPAASSSSVTPTTVASTSTAGGGGASTSTNSASPQSGNASSDNGQTLSAGAIAGIAIGGFVILAVAAFVLFMILRKKKKTPGPDPVQAEVRMAEQKINLFSPQPDQTGSLPLVYSAQGHHQAYNYGNIPPPPGPIELPGGAPQQPAELASAPPDLRSSVR